MTDINYYGGGKTGPALFTFDEDTPEWSVSTSYVVRDAVTYNGSFWGAKVNNTGVAPGSDDSVWYIISKGIPDDQALTETLSNLTALRAYNRDSLVDLASVSYGSTSGDGNGGQFYYDSTDTTSSDDGYSVIVGADDARWKRVRDDGRFDLRSEAVTAVAAGWVPISGRTYLIGGLEYFGSLGAMYITDLNGLIPLRKTVALEHFGAVGDGTTNDTTAFILATTYLAAIGGGEVLLGDGNTYAITNVGFTWNKITLRGHGVGRSTLKAHPDSDGTSGWLYNSDSGSGTTRACNYPKLMDMDLDGYDLPYSRWLSQSDGTAITDPEDDYVMGSGALAAGISGVSLTAVLTDDAVTSVTINNGGSGWFGHPLLPYGRVARLTIDGDGEGAWANAILNDSGVIIDTYIRDPGTGYTTITISCGAVTGEDLTGSLSGGGLTSIAINDGGSGGDIENQVRLRFDGDGQGAKGYAVVSGGTITSIVMEREGTGYTTPPTVTTLGGYADITLLTTSAVDRRNPDYNQVSAGLYFARTNGLHIENVRFSGFRRMGIGEGGGLNTVMRNMTFVDCGKDDGAYHCIWTQSQGSANTKNILIENVYIDGAERTAVAFMPKEGGILRNLFAKDCGESTIFINGEGNSAGGRIIIEDCQIIGGYVTDLVSHAIEINGADQVYIRNNYIEGAVQTAINAPGCVDLRVTGNTFVNNITLETKTGDGKKPFGPFNERYGFNFGSMPECAEDLSIVEGGLFWVGTLGGIGCKDNIFRDNRFSDDRSVYPGYIFVQVKSGGNNLSGDFVVTENNFVDMPTLTREQFWKRTITDVWKTGIPVHIYNNRGLSNTEIVSQTFTETGNVEIDCGFRPSKVTVYARDSSLSDVRIALGSFRYDAAYTDDDLTANSQSFCLSFAITDPLALESRFKINTIAHVIDESNNDIARVNFGGWTETGFIANCTVHNDDIAVYFVCDR